MPNLKDCWPEIEKRFTDSNPYDPIRFVQAYGALNARGMSAMAVITEPDQSEAMTAMLEKVEEIITETEWYAREEAYAAWVGHNRKYGELFKIDELPDDSVHVELEDEHPVFTFPLWMFGYSRPKNSGPALPHRRGFIRENHFWYALVKAMCQDYLEKTQVDLNVLPCENAHITILFKTRWGYARDLDHFRLTSLVNALVRNRLLRSDHPSRLTYTVAWEPETDIKNERVSISIRRLNKDSKMDNKCSYVGI